MRYVLLGLLLVGCSSFEPSELGAVRFDPPPSYQTEWRVAEQCSGRQGDLSRVTFYVVPDSEAFDTPKGRAVGYWKASTQSIVLAGAVLAEAVIVRHEMLHALGIHSHKDPAFRNCRALWADWKDDGEPDLLLPESLLGYMPELWRQGATE